MLLYALRRLIYLVPVAFGVSLLVFALVHLAPGDPISAIVPPDAPKEVVDKLKEYYGFDKPLPVQYLRWLGVTLTGDLGTSIGTGRSVASEVGSAFGNTIILAIAATLFAFSLAVILGTAAAYAKSRIVDRLVTMISLIGVSVPHFWLAIVLVIIFAVELGVLPPMGIGPENSTGWTFDRAHLAHMVLPTIALSVIPLGVVTRTVRSTVKETLSMEFVTALQAKGMRDSRILFHVLKNAAPTCLAVMGLQAGNLIGGSLGILAGFVGGKTNMAIMRVMDVFYAFPSVLLAISLSGAMGAGTENTLLSLTLVFIPPICRVSESVTTQVRGFDFVDAAKASGASAFTIVRVHVLGNVLGPILVYATSLISVAIILAAGLSFLGLGVKPPEPEWGLMLNTLRQAIYVNPVLAALPGVMIFITSICFNLMSDGLRAAMDVKA